MMEWYDPQIYECADFCLRSIEWETIERTKDLLGDVLDLTDMVVDRNPRP